MILIFIFIIGLCIGSFLNVVIYRTEKEISIVSPSSFCPQCKSPIKWYDNIPVISYLLLGGKCRNCSNRISYWYPAVEIVSAIITAVLFLKWGYENTLWFISATLISYVLIVVSVIDFKTMMLSDLFSYIIAFIGIISSFYNPLFEGSFYSKISSSVLGIIAGAGSIYLLMKIGKIIYKKDAVGDGDMFLMGAIGSFVGAKGIIDVVIIASFLGAGYGFILIITKKLERFSYIPFGPFLSAASLIKIYFDIKILNLFN